MQKNFTLCHVVTSPLFLPVNNMRPLMWFHGFCLVTHVSMLSVRNFLPPLVCMCVMWCTLAQGQRLCKNRNGLCLQVLYVPDPDYVSSVGSSPSLSPISPLSPTSSEADLEKVCSYKITHMQKNTTLWKESR